MAKLAISVVGAAAGFALGGPQGALIGWGLGSMAGSYIFPDTVAQEGPRLNDLSVQISSVGVGIPWVRGSARISGNVFWSGGLEEHATTTEQGGKGGGGTTVEQTTYTYTCSFAIGLCQGEIGGIRRIWANKKLIGTFDADSFDFQQVATTDDLLDSLEIHLGSETQTASSVMESYKGAGEVPGYRGLAYLVFENLLLTEYGNRIPLIEVEVISSGSASSVDYELDVTTDNWLSGVAIYNDNLVAVTGDTNSVLKVYDGMSETERYGLNVSGVVQDITIMAGDLWYVMGSNVVTRASIITGQVKQTYTFTGYPDFYAIASDGDRLILGSSPGPAKVYVTGTLSGGHINDVIDIFDSPVASGWYQRFTVYSGDLFILGVKSGSGDTVYQMDGISETESNNFVCTEDDDFQGIATWRGNLVLAGSANSKAYVYEGISNTQKTVDSFTMNSVSLATLITDLCALGGVTDIDTDSLVGSVCGYTVARPMTCRQALDPILTAYHLDAYEAEYALTFKKRLQNTLDDFCNDADATTACSSGDCSGFDFDADNTPATIDPGGWIYVYLAESCGPYTWEVSGTGYSLTYNQTEDGINILTAASGTCGVDIDAFATITVTDLCGNTATAIIRSTGGQWVYTGRKSGQSFSTCYSCGDVSPPGPCGVGVCRSVYGTCDDEYWVPTWLDENDRAWTFTGVCRRGAWSAPDLDTENCLLSHNCHPSYWTASYGSPVDPPCTNPETCGGYSYKCWSVMDADCRQTLYCEDCVDNYCTGCYISLYYYYTWQCA